MVILCENEDFLKLFLPTKLSR